MSDSRQEALLEEVPEAIVTERRRGGLALVWIVPLVALAIGLVLVWRSYMEQGPRITIRFDQAAGVEENKTRIRYRDVVVGTVEEVRFAGDFSEVVVTARMDQGLDGLLTENTRFWVVRPRISLTGASGIDTLVSGVYIAMDPGDKGKLVTEFKGLSEPPNVLSDDVGTQYRLRAESLGSLSIGSPVYHRQVRVGRVTSYRLEPQGDHVAVDIFVDAPHDRLVRTNSRFWNASGVRVDLAGGGVSLRMESLAALVSGGVAFDTPEELEASEPAPPLSTFTLYESRKASREEPLRFTVSYVLYFDETVRGLERNAPVEFRGIRVGTVKDVTLERNPDTENIRIQVLISMEPERIPLSPEGAARLRDAKLMRQIIERMVERGLRARLRTGNLLTGQLIVDFEFLPDAKPARVDYSGRYPALPTAPNELANLMTSLTTILDKLEKLPLDEIGEHLRASSEGLERLLEDPALHALPDDARELLATLEQKSGPLMDDLSAMLASARQTLETVRAATSAQGAIGSELSRTLREMSAAAKAVKSLSDYLERHPEALLKGKRR